MLRGGQPAGPLPLSHAKRSRLAPICSPKGRPGFCLPPGFALTGSSRLSISPHAKLRNQTSLTVSRQKTKQKEGKVVQAPTPTHTDSPFVASEEQQRAIDAVLAGGNLFLTGCAGTGKSATLLELRKRLQEKKYGSRAEYERRVAVVAMTGLAATLVGGVTLHSLLRLGLTETFEDFERMINSKKLLSELLELRTLILDEAGMMSAELLQLLDGYLTAARKKAAKEGLAGRIISRKHYDEYMEQFDKPFGGLQLILSGDFFQLAPIEGKKQARQREPHHSGGHSKHRPFHNRGFLFQAPVFHYGGFTVVELTKVFRQDEEGFVRLLNAVRCGSDVECSAALQQLAESCSRELDCSDGIKPTLLFSTNEKVAGRNEEELAALPGEQRTFEAIDEVRVTQEPPPFVYAPLTSEKLLSAEDMEKLAQELEAAADGDQHLLALSSLKGPAQTRAMELREEWRGQAAAHLREVGKKGGGLFRECQATAKVVLKTDAQVMLLRNVDLESNLANGSRGVVVRMESITGDDLSKAIAIADRIESRGGEGYGREVMKWLKQHKALPVVRFTDGQEVKVLPFVFTSFVPGNGVCIRVQVPLKLAWAMTVHKAQGMTLDRVVFDMSKLFGHGMAYTGLSRARNLAGLQTCGTSPRKIKQQVMSWWRHHQEGRRFIERSESPVPGSEPWCWWDKYQPLASTPQNPQAALWFEEGPDAFFAWQQQEQQQLQQQEEEEERRRQQHEQRQAADDDDHDDEKRAQQGGEEDEEPSKRLPEAAAEAAAASALPSTRPAAEISSPGQQQQQAPAGAIAAAVNTGPAAARQSKEWARLLQNEVGAVRLQLFELQTRRGAVRKLELLDPMLRLQQLEKELKRLAEWLPEAEE